MSSVPNKPTVGSPTEFDPGLALPEAAASAIAIRPFTGGDARAVRDLFIAANRLLAPPQLRDSFESYILRSLKEEIGRIPGYYGERGGGFWVAAWDRALVGMFGLEQAGPAAMELRRMYVAPGARRRGVARLMLQRAEIECRRRGARELVLSTSELQQDALAPYRGSGFRMLREEIAESASNKTVGGGLRRYHFSKGL